MSDTDCSKVVTIPQFTGTCWFNALLMCIFYSEGMRSILLNKAREWPEDSETHKIFHDILTNRYLKNTTKNAVAFYNKMRPETILQKLHDANDKEFIYNEKKHSSFKGIWYIRKLLLHLKVNVAVLDVKQERRGFKVNYILYDSKTNQLVDVESHENEMMKLIYSTNTVIEQKENPDVIVIHMHTENDTTNYNKAKQWQSNFKPLQHEITVNNNKYVADGFMLANYNIDSCDMAHEIAGVTCGGKRHIYNGWMKETQDLAKGDNTAFQKDPCPLMEYDWLNMMDYNHYCISRTECKLEKKDPPIQDDICFKFQHGQRAYIYVRQETHGGRALQKICYKHKMDNIQAYLKGVYEAYYLNDPYLRNMNPSEFSQNAKNIIFKFAHAQDSVYDKGLQMYTKLNPSHTDDIFEIYFLEKYGNGKKKGVTDLELIHDAWTLSRLVMFNDNMTELVFHKEAGDTPIVNTKVENAANKQLIKLTFAGGIKIDGMGDPLYPFTIVQRRRLAQFVEYNELSEEEKIKDQPAVDLFNSLKPDDNGYILSYNDRSLYGGAKKRTIQPKATAERVQIGSRKQVVYVGPRGGKYIKQKGAFIRLPKAAVA